MPSQGWIRVWVNPNSVYVKIRIFGKTLILILIDPMFMVIGHVHGSWQVLAVKARLCLITYLSMCDEVAGGRVVDAGASGVRRG